MATNNPTPRTFLSYCWAEADSAAVESIDKDFKSIGITLTRDNRDIGYAQSIKKFMESIGEHDFVVMIISDDYLKRKNCMYEACEVIGSHKFSQKVLPVLLDNVRHIFDHNNRIPYYQFWKEKVETLKPQVSEYPNEDLINELKMCQSIYLRLDAFFRIIVDMNHPTFKELQQDNYKPMLDRMGIEHPDVIIEVLAANRIKDKEEQELTLEDLDEKYPNNKYIWFQRAWLAAEQKQFKKAKKYYEATLGLDENYPTAHHNYATLLATHFKESDETHEQARKHFERALELNPNDAMTHDAYAGFLTDNLQEHDKARDHYEQAIKLNPNGAEILYNYAILLTVKFQEYDNARQHFEQALVINPNYVQVHNNYANLLASHFKEYKKAREHCERAIELDANLWQPHIGLALLYFYPLNNPKKAAEHLAKARELGYRGEE